MSPITLEDLKARRGALADLFVESLPKIESRVKFCPEFDSVSILPSGGTPLLDDRIAVIKVRIFETLDGELVLKVFLYDVCSSGVVFAPYDGPIGIHTYMDVVAEWMKRSVIGSH